MLAGREGWLANETIRRAIVIDEGIILDENVLSFQGRDARYPHEQLQTATN